MIYEKLIRKFQQQTQIFSFCLKCSDKILYTSENCHTVKFCENSHE